MRHDVRAMVVAVAVSVACLTLAPACGAGAAAPATPVLQDGAPPYLPLAVGNRWELRARNAPDPMVLEVTGREGDAYVVRWTNPFVPIVFRLRDEGNRIVLAGLDMGQGNAPMPGGTVYWDFTLGQGQRWQSPVGTGEVSARGARVQAPAGEYRDAVEVRTIDQQRQSMYWTFAPNVGLVRWGQGRDAYLLTSVRLGGDTAVSRRGPGGGPRTEGRPSAPRRAGTRAPLIGLDATPHGKHGKGRAGRTAALQQAFDAGLTLLHVAPKWNEYEKQPGRLALPEDADVIGEFAGRHDLPIALNLRVVDTNQRSMPKDLERRAFDDPVVVDRVRAALRAFPAVFKRQTRILAIGNEIDPYFGQHQGELAAYESLVRQVEETARREFPNAQFTVNLTFGATADMGRYRGILALGDIVSFTYYPLNADFTMRPVSDLRGDVQRMLDAAGGRPVYIQEIGYASADRLRSSPDMQARFYEEAFAAIREHEDRIVGATFLFMSELPRLVVEYLGLYYGAFGSGNFKAYLQTLGIVAQDGTPKPAWDVFRREALALRGGR